MKSLKIFFGFFLIIPILAFADNANVIGSILQSVINESAKQEQAKANTQWFRLVAVNNGTNQVDFDRIWQANQSKIKNIYKGTVQGKEVLVLGPYSYQKAQEMQQQFIAKGIKNVQFLAREQIIITQRGEAILEGQKNNQQTESDNRNKNPAPQKPTDIIIINQSNGSLIGSCYGVVVKTNQLNQSQIDNVTMGRLSEKYGAHKNRLSGQDSMAANIAFEDSYRKTGLISPQLADEAIRYCMKLIP